MEIDDWRDEIDAIDEQLVDLLNRRSQCAIEIGRIKRKLDMPVYSPAREMEVIKHVINSSRGPLDAGAVRRLFERIIDESRRIERITVEKEESPRAKSRGRRKGAAARPGVKSSRTRKRRS